MKIIDAATANATQDTANAVTATAMLGKTANANAPNPTAANAPHTVHNCLIIFLDLANGR